MLRDGQAAAMVTVDEQLNSVIDGKPKWDTKVKTPGEQREED